MNVLPPALDELIRAPEAREAERRIMLYVRVLEQEGVTTRAIARGLLSCLCLIAQSEYMKWGPERLWTKQFVKRAANTLYWWWEDTTLREERAYLQAKSEAEGGGSVTH